MEYLFRATASPHTTAAKDSNFQSSASQQKPSVPRDYSTLFTTLPTGGKALWTNVPARVLQYTPKGSICSSSTTESRVISKNYPLYFRCLQRQAESGRSNTHHIQWVLNIILQILFVAVIELTTYIYIFQWFVQEELENVKTGLYRKGLLFWSAYAVLWAAYFVDWSENHD